MISSRGERVQLHNVSTVQTVMNLRGVFVLQVPNAQPNAKCLFSRCPRPKGLADASPNRLSPNGVRTESQRSGPTLGARRQVDRTSSSQLRVMQA